jgi:hypothetical protein
VTLRLDAAFASPADLVAAYDAELSRKGLLVRGATVAGASPLTPCRVGLSVGGALVLELDATLAAAVPGVGVAVMLAAVPAELLALVARARAGEPLDGESPDGDAGPEGSAAGPGEEEPLPPAGPLSERLKALTVAQKISLAITCDRETRFHLLRDHNKTLHVFVLRNPRIGLDEVQAAAKMPSLSPDALKAIAEHREWGQNATICTSLVRNPRTLLPLALRLLERIPVSEVRALAKGGARDQIVQAARKRL